MDRALFDERVRTLRNGECVHDSSFFSYCRSAVYEMTEALEAYHSCCLKQDHTIQNLRGLNRQLEESVLSHMRHITELNQTIQELTEQIQLLSIFANPEQAAKDRLTHDHGDQEGGERE